MKLVFSICLVFLVNWTHAQERFSFGRIDWAAQSINASTPEELAPLLTRDYATELEKVRAIFSWITHHIAYNTGIITRRASSSRYSFDPSDTVSIWRTANEMTALRVMFRRTAVCEGYARLFKTLCDYAGIRSEIISGYARCHMDGPLKFRTNHSWNAVMIDSAWHLLDLTWASGYIDFSNEFVRQIDESYFLTSPEVFIRDHYPEDLRWALLENAPVPGEFRKSPYRYKSFVKYSIRSYFPSGGIIEAAVGDTIKFELELSDIDKDRKISADPFFDSSFLTGMPASVFLQPIAGKDKMVYSFIVDSPETEWIHLFYNDDLVLRYKFNIKKEQPSGN